MNVMHNVLVRLKLVETCRAEKERERERLCAQILWLLTKHISRESIHNTYLSPPFHTTCAWGIFFLFFPIL